MNTQPLTNFDPKDIETYVKAVRAYEDLTGRYGHFIISMKDGWGDNYPFYSLHRTEGLETCSDFWDVFEKISKIWPTRVQKLLKGI